MPSPPDPTRAPTGTETELKLALPTDDPSGLLARLSRADLLNRRKPVRQHLHSVYFDTPTQQLRQAQAALRIRRVDADGPPQWVQTLKTAPRSRSALSQRGEWEAPVAGPALEPDALAPEAWAAIDPDGTVLAALQPCFVTDFTRTIWMVRRRDGSRVEVALDIGSVVSGDRSTPICELELELKAGSVTALFDVAQRIAATVPVLPLAMSKAQRGHALAAGTTHAPAMADPPRLKAGMALRETARLVLREMFGQFTANITALAHSDDPELVHQARVAWRRLRSARRLFKPVLPPAGQPDWTALEPLLTFLGAQRDLDVARTETLPAWRAAYVCGSPERARAWDATLQLLARAGSEQRAAVRHALATTAPGLCLLQATRWLDGPESAETGDAGLQRLKPWARDRTARLHRRLERANHAARDPQAWHQVRLMAKRTRYSIEALQSVLPPRMVRKWRPQAVELQRRIGADRDLDQAIALLERLAAPTDQIAFLRGVAAGRSTR